jgi:hypothetical protein
MHKFSILTALAISVCAGVCQAESNVTPEIEAAMKKGLDFLTSTQNKDGTWPGQYGETSGVIGCAILAYLAHGEQPGEGKHGRAIMRSVDYIVSTRDKSNGLLAGRRKSSPMYSHGFATLALAEVYGQIPDKKKSREVAAALKKAVGLTVSCQAPSGQNAGGWRYNVSPGQADTTVSGAHMMALRGAATGGIEVPFKTIQNGVKYYKRMYCAGGGFGYTNSSGPNAIRGGIGALVLCLSGEYKSKEATTTAEYLLVQGDGGLTSGSHFYYMCYYVSQAMRQSGKRYWDRWNSTMTPRLISLQRANGSWATNNNTLLETSMALLSIAINYDYLPIYQR